MSDYLTPRVCEVLLVEDNPADAELIQHALAREWSDLHVKRVESGDQLNWPMLKSVPVVSRTASDFFVTPSPGTSIIHRCVIT